MDSETENRVAVVGVRGCGVHEGGQRAQTSTYKVNQSWASNVQRGDYR